MKYIFFFLIFITFFNYIKCFELGLWRGSSYIFLKHNNFLDLKNPYITTFNYTSHFNINKFINENYYTNDKQELKLKLNYNDNLGGIILKTDKYFNNSIFFNNQINFFKNDMRSIININYNLINNKLNINYINIYIL